MTPSSMKRPDRRPHLIGRIALAAAFAVPLALGTTAARAEDPPSDAPPQNPEVKVERTASGQKIIRITTGIVVEGRVQKPNAFYVLQRSSIDYDWEALRQDFLPRILESVGSSPF